MQAPSESRNWFRAYVKAGVVTLVLIATCAFNWVVQYALTYGCTEPPYESLSGWSRVSSWFVCTTVGGVVSVAIIALPLCIVGVSHSRATRPYRFRLR
jgi:hypothetical protein